MTHAPTHLAMNETIRKFLGLSMGQGLIFLTQVVAIVWFAAGVKSDTRNLDTRVLRNEQGIAELKTDQTGDRERVNQKLTEIATNIGILLERTRDKVPAPMK